VMESAIHIVRVWLATLTNSGVRLSIEAACRCRSAECLGSRIILRKPHHLRMEGHSKCESNQSLLHQRVLSW
jgi:hypothetical protein